MTDRSGGLPGASAASSIIVLEVPGMDCVSCARRISDRLEQLNGVEKVEPRVISRDIRVEFDSARIGEEDIAANIKDLGYEIGRPGDGSDTTTSQASVWATREGLRAYTAGVLLAAGLFLRAFDLSPAISSFPWRLDAGGLSYILAALIGGYNFFPKGLRAARRLKLDMNFLMTVAIFGAIVIGEFVEAASIAFLFSIAELLESHAIDRARRSIEQLLQLAPATARVRRADGEEVLRVEDVQLGDVVIVRPGEKVPIDGHVTAGISTVDQSPITGESLPVKKGQADTVFAGSINCEGYLEVTASKRAEDSTLAHIIQLVEEAELAKAPSERFVERFARVYTPAVTVVAVAIMALPPLLAGETFSVWFVRGLTLLVISCPCALVISTPVAVVSALTSAARNGVLIKGGVHLEALGGIGAVAFDKTGTLTAGRLEVVDVIAAADDSTDVDQIISIAGALESRSEHPIAEAIMRRAVGAGDGAPYRISDFQSLPGQGARARLNGRVYQIGRSELFGEATNYAEWQRPMLQEIENGRTAVCVGTEDRVLGLIAIADTEREHARHAIEGLRALGIRRIVMLTGDHESTARRVAESIGVTEWYADLLPEDKADKIREIEGVAGAVAMVGDGVNDAPALAAATVGIAMGAIGSDVALETADVALMGDDLSRLPYLFRLSRRSGSVIRQNIFTSIALKLSLAVGVFPGLVTLITAVLVGDLGASLAVTGNALRLARVRR